VSETDRLWFVLLYALVTERELRHKLETLQKDLKMSVLDWSGAGAVGQREGVRSGQAALRPAVRPSYEKKVSYINYKLYKRI
jgi:hypothetical protein